MKSTTGHPDRTGRTLWIVDEGVNNIRTVPSPLIVSSGLQQSKNFNEDCNLSLVILDTENCLYLFTNWIPVLSKQHKIHGNETHLYVTL